jgi:hypothetical protein
VQGHGQKLTRLQEKALAALLTADTNAAAALQAGISERTLQRWLAELPEFRSAYRDARRQVLDASVAALQRATTKAVQTLIRAMDDASAPVAIRAAIATLDHAWRGTEVGDIAEQLEALRLEVQELRDAHRHAPQRTEAAPANGRGAPPAAD